MSKGALIHPKGCMRRGKAPNPKMKGGLLVAIYHCHIQIISRGKGKSAVAAAAYRSGDKITNQWDGVTHDYTRKGGVIYSEIMLPEHAPPEYADRSVLWNSVELAEKAVNSQLAREIEIALPMELEKDEKINLVRTYVQDSFVANGMCADFFIHDKGDGNPHVHIMLTMRSLLEDGSWGAKCRKVYDLDKNGERIPNGKGGWKTHRVNVNDWNDEEKAEIWRTAWAEYANQALEKAGQRVRIDNRSYVRQGIDKIPGVHLGVAVCYMEHRGIVTDKGNLNRQIAADNKLLVEIEKEISKLSEWAERHSGKDTLTEKIAALQKDFYALRSEIVGKETRITILSERLEMWRQYQKYLPLSKQTLEMKPKKREQFAEAHQAEFILFTTAKKYLGELKKAGDKIEPKRWQKEIAELTNEKDLQYRQMIKMREEIMEIERRQKAAERQYRFEPSQKKEEDLAR